MVVTTSTPTLAVHPFLAKRFLLTCGIAYDPTCDEDQRCGLGAFGEMANDVGGGSCGGVAPSGAGPQVYAVGVTTLAGSLAQCTGEMMNGRIGGDAPPGVDR